MKNIFIILALLIGLTASAQSYKVEGNNYSTISSTGGVKQDSINTGFTFTDKAGTYPIYVSNSGSCYINKTSKKTNKSYRKYLGKEISLDICKKLNIKYKIK